MDNLTLKEVRKLYESPSRLRHKVDIDKALTMLLTYMENERRDRAIDQDLQRRQ